ncbi:MAG: hypothetical protein OEV08_06425, partial [Nitrospira sp.]|nr:hypothetical protein [Nitrospira sp.]
MARSTFIRLAGIAMVFLAMIVGSWFLFGPGSLAPGKRSGRDFHRFTGVSGPAHVSVVPPAVPTDWTVYRHGSASRLAILLTDPDSCWLGLAHGLNAIGIPFLITRNVQDAMAHPVVLVYPTISGKVLSPDELQALAGFTRSGGTLIGTQVLGGGLNEIFG